jgi:hypothetical protein
MDANVDKVRAKSWKDALKIGNRKSKGKKALIKIMLLDHRAFKSTQISSGPDHFVEAMSDPTRPLPAATRSSSSAQTEPAILRALKLSYEHLPELFSEKALVSEGEDVHVVVVSIKGRRNEEATPSLWDRVWGTSKPRHTINWDAFLID